MKAYDLYFEQHCISVNIRLQISSNVISQKYKTDILSWMKGNIQYQIYYDYLRSTPVCFCLYLYHTRSFGISLSQSVVEWYLFPDTNRHKEKISSDIKQIIGGYDLFFSKTAECIGYCTEIKILI